MDVVYIVMMECYAGDEISSIFETKEKAEHYIKEYQERVPEVKFHIDTWRVH